MEVYLDNSATSWPKPPAVIQAMTDYLTCFGVSPGRSGYGLSVKAAREVFDTREMIAEFFNQPDSERVVFTANATHALNICFKGLLKPGDHVIISHFEHNSVYRPLKYLENKGLIELTNIGSSENSDFDLVKFQSYIKSNTRMVATLHGSNVNGAILPIRQIGEICKANQILYTVDAAQTAGLLAVDMVNDNIDLLAFSGHKSLYGPPGVGVLCIKPDIEIETLIQGGTGSRSELASHPEFYPDHLEAGTPNTAGIIGLKAGLKFIIEKGIENIRQHQFQLTKRLVTHLTEMEGVTLYLPHGDVDCLPMISLNIKALPPSQTAMLLDRDFEIMTRSGLHCSPLAHQSMGTFPQGTVRLSPGFFNTLEEMDYTIEAIRKISSTRYGVK